MPKDKLSIEVDVEKLGVCTRHDLHNVRQIRAVHRIDHEGDPAGFLKAKGALSPHPDGLSPEEQVRRMRDAS